MVFQKRSPFTLYKTINTINITSHSNCTCVHKCKIAYYSNNSLPLKYVCSHGVLTFSVVYFKFRNSASALSLYYTWQKWTELAVAGNNKSGKVTTGPSESSIPERPVDNELTLLWSVTISFINAYFKTQRTIVTKEHIYLTRQQIVLI